jgi:hypothetical protein
MRLHHHSSNERISGSFWWGIQKNAKKRGLVFDLDKKAMWDLFLIQNGKCALSGVEIYFGKGLTRKGQTASIDRIDSSKGYVIGNVRWVHKIVNQMKWSISDEDFLNWIRCIANHQKL